MKNGDLANTMGVTIGFKCIDFLVKYKDKTFGDKIKNVFFGKTKRAEIDQAVLSCMENIYRNTECSVDLIIENEVYTEELKQLLDNLPFNRIILIDKPSQISLRLMNGDLTYYVDNDAERRSLVNNQYAIDLRQLMNMFKRER